MSGAKDDTADEQRHKRFLVSMSEIGASDGRFKLIHGNDGTSVSASRAFADIVGTEITFDSLFKTKKKKKAVGDVVKHLKKSYNKTVAKNDNLRLPAPASTVEHAKLARSATRERFAERMSRWEAAVHGRRAADSVSFPLQKPDLSVKTNDDRKTTFKTTTPLEREIAMLLHGRTKDRAASSEQMGLGLSMREAREKLNELAKIRAHERHHQLKMKRQNKIKSKRYRRHLRRERKKEMDAMDVDAKADVDRVTERASLKHTKASKKLHFVAKHADKNVKNRILGEKDKKKRDLKAKPSTAAAKPSSEEEDDDDDEKDVVEDADKDPNNPWTASAEMREGKLLEMIKTGAAAKRNEDERKNVDPDNFLRVRVKNGNFDDGDDDDEAEENSEDDDVERSNNVMAEAFAAADDDVVRDFRKEARDKAKAKRAKNAKVSSLPGWGTWAGSSSSVVKRKPRPREKKPREAKKDGDSGGYRVIVNESSRGQSARSHQTSNIPFPFNSVRDFEASIRLPVGDTFIPRTSFNQLVRPKVCVAKGAIVEPMHLDQLVRRGVKLDDENDTNDADDADGDRGIF